MIIDRCSHETKKRKVVKEIRRGAINMESDRTTSGARWATKNY